MLTKAVPSPKTPARMPAYVVRIAVFIAAFTHLQIAAAQYPDVHQEPFHKPLLETGPFRYLNVSASPGDTTAMHSHRLPILYLCVSGSEVWLNEEGADQRRVNLPTGWIGSDMYSDSTVFNHRFAVIGDSGLHIIAVERMQRSEHGGLHFETEPIFAENGFVVYALSGENLHDSGKDSGWPRAFGGWPAVLFKGKAVSPSGKESGPGALLRHPVDGHPENTGGAWSFNEDAEIWVVVPDNL